FAIASQAFAAGTVILRATVVFVCVIFSVVWSIRIALTRFACPLWVKSGHRTATRPCPLYPQKRTSVECSAMAVKCQKRTFRVAARSHHRGKRESKTDRGPRGAR